MSEFTIQKATRMGVIPLIGIYAESGCGKTMSALLLARGLVGPSGLICMIDTESRRGSLYADVIPGGFSVIDLTEPFTPERFISAMQSAIESGAKVIVIDSTSHEWQLGVCEMADENESKGKPGIHNWKGPKFSHAKFIQFILRSPVPIICCIRAKYKTRQKKVNGKTEILRDDYVSPIQSEEFIYEMTAHLVVLEDHTIVLTKHSHPDLKKCFPEDRKGPIEIKHGELISKWCSAAGGATLNQPPIAPPIAGGIKKKLWALTDKIHLGNAKALEQYLWDENLLDPDKALADLTESELRAVYSATENKIRDGEGVTP